MSSVPTAQKILNATVEHDIGIVKPPWFEDFIQDKNKYYRSFFIPKRELQRELSSGKKLNYPSNRIPDSELHRWRKISAPIKCLKDIQTKIRDALYRRRPSKFDHCVRKRNRYMANQKIAGYNVVLAMDIKDAFPSTKEWMIERTLAKEGFRESDIELIRAIATLNGSLPQGSPCSPVLLNLCRKKLDYRLSGYAKKYYNAEMVVYVDNFYFASNDNNLNKAIPAIKGIARREGYEFPDKKIYLMRKGSRQGGLGLVASKSPDGTIVVQPQRRHRLKLRSILHSGLKRFREGSRPWPDLTTSHVRGLVECYKGSIYYDRFRKQIDEIEGKTENATKGGRPHVVYSHRASGQGPNRGSAQACRSCGQVHN